jgi:hypothetical protein
MLKTIYLFIIRNKLILAFNLMFSISILFIAIFSYFSLPQIIPLFYSFLEPKQQLTQKEFIFLIPIFSLIFNFMNFSLLFLVRKFSRLFYQLILQINVTWQILLLIALLSYPSYFINDITFFDLSNFRIYHSTYYFFI